MSNFTFMDQEIIDYIDAFLIAEKLSGDIQWRKSSNRSMIGSKVLNESFSLSKNGSGNPVEFSYRDDFVSIWFFLYESRNYRLIEELQQHRLSLGLEKKTHKQYQKDFYIFHFSFLEKDELNKFFNKYIKGNIGKPGYII